MRLQGGLGPVIEAQLAEERTRFLMDYNTSLAECDDAIGLYAPTSDELAQREVTRSKWWPDDQPLATNSNGTIACGEQMFTLRRGGQNDFALVCERA